VRSGKLRVLAAASNERNRLLPDVPTFAEIGHPQVNVSLWYGLLAPAGTPRPVLAKLNGALAATLDSPEVLRLFVTQGLNATPSTPAAFAKYLRSEIEKWVGVVRAAKIAQL
jgi:tripartite-type tricarboxylate transporter receptor subunit TctC